MTVALITNRGTMRPLRRFIRLLPLLAAGAAGRAEAPRLAPWVEATQPFFSSVLDVRKAGPGFPADNLTPRGLILPLEHKLWIGFDVDLLRVSAVWEGSGVAPVALAPGSYHHPSRKTGPGQKRLPTPVGAVWLANGIYPGWQSGGDVSFLDPRTPAPTIAEVGRGPLPGNLGRFGSIQLIRDGAILHYTVAGVGISERFSAEEHAPEPVLLRHIDVAPSAAPLLLIVGRKRIGDAIDVDVAPEGAGPGEPGIGLVPRTDAWVVRVAPHPRAVAFRVAMTKAGDPREVRERAFTAEPNPTRWPGWIETNLVASSDQAAFVVDRIGLPSRNPWGRDVRAADIQFMRDGTGVVVTVDGDVWLVRGLGGSRGGPRWKRFASGLHEPMSLAIRDGEIFVFDRNGIWRLRDVDGDGEADVHELFSNAFAQTADTREFPNAIRLAPRGEFVIAKGGQEATTLGKNNGSVLRIASDGRSFRTLGWGFRQPFAGVNLETGLVTASDQEGNYVPSTPLYILHGRQFHGFLSPLLPRERYPAPIAEPLTWISHQVIASAISQVWLQGARMGPLTGGLAQISFNRPGLFRVLLNERGSRPQAAAVCITDRFDFPPLNGSVNPADGQLYLAGFQVFGWGTTATEMSGLARVRYTGAPSLIPDEVIPMDKGLLVRFDVPLDRSAAENPADYVVASWHYRRTYKYGSARYREGGLPGTDPLPVSNAYLSRNRRSVFLAIPGMMPAMQMQLEWSLRSRDGLAMKDLASFTPYELVRFDPRAEGFGDLVVDMRRRIPVAAAPEVAISAAQGARIAQQLGCVACHSPTDAKRTTPGPSWVNLFGRPCRLADGRTVVADEGYIRESILNPAAKIVAGYEKGEFAMPSFAGVVSDAQIRCLILYIETLRERAP